MKKIFIVLFLFCFSKSYCQDNLTPTKKIPLKSKFETKNLIEKSFNRELSFIFFVTPSDTSVLYKFIRESNLNSSTKDINFFVQLFENGGDDENPTLDGAIIKGNECFFMTNDKTFGKYIQTIYSNEKDITLDLIPIKRNAHLYKINIGSCSKSKWYVFNPRISDIIKNYYDNLYPLKTNSILLAKIDSMFKEEKQDISGVNNKFSTMGEQLNPSHYLSYSANYNLGPKPNSIINTNSQKYTSNITSKKGFGLGIDYHFIVSENENTSHQIATGIHFVNNNILLSADSVQFNYNQTDKDGEKYQRRIYGINIKEEANINFFNVPLYYSFNYKLNEKAKVYVKGGLQFMYIFSATYAATDGEFSYRGKYKGIKDEFENINEYDFYEKQQVNKNTHNLNVKKFNTYGFIGGGFKYAIDKKTDFTIGMNVNIAGSNLLKQKTATYITSQTANDYNSLLYSFDKFKMNPISFEFGLVSKF